MFYLRAYVLIVFFLISGSLWASPNLPNAIKIFKASRKSEMMLDPKTIKLLLWNIHKEEGGDNWIRDYQKLTENHDLIAIQEIFLNPLMIKMLDNSNSFTYVMGVSFFYKNIGDTGVATASRVQPLESKTYHSPDVENFYGTPKASLLSFYPLKGKLERLLVLNTHALNYDLGTKYKKHLEDLVPLIKAHKGPVIWAGDFNTWSDRRLEIFEKVMKDLGLQATTFLDDQRSTFMWDHVVDHVYSRGLKVIKSQVFSKITSSDHKPISVEFAIK